MTLEKKVDLLVQLVNSVTEYEAWNRTERAMFVRFFLKENFSWITQKAIAEMTGITEHSTVSLQIKKLNTEEKYHFTIVKIRRMIKELELNS